MSHELTPHIVTPEVCHAAGIMAVRREVFVEELVTSQISPKAAWEHVRDWGDDDSIRGYGVSMQEWLARSEQFYLRAVMLGREVAGWCLGQRVEKEFSFNNLQVIQLRQDVRRKGVGRRLLTEFAETVADPQLPTRLTVLEKNHPAIAFYRAQGFKETGERQTWAFSGETTGVLTMEKSPQRV